MLCYVLLSTDSGHCIHAALRFLRMEFLPRFSDYFHLISFFLKNVNLLLQSDGRAVPTKLF